MRTLVASGFHRSYGPGPTARRTFDPGFVLVDGAGVIRGDYRYRTTAPDADKLVDYMNVLAGEIRNATVWPRWPTRRPTCSCATREELVTTEWSRPDHRRPRQSPPALETGPSAEPGAPSSCRTGGPGLRRYRPLLLVAVALAALVVAGPGWWPASSPISTPAPCSRRPEPAPSLEGLHYTSGEPVDMAGLEGNVTLVCSATPTAPTSAPPPWPPWPAPRPSSGPAERDRVRVLMVTVDDARDDAATLEHYVTAFDPSFQGVLGPDEVTARVASLYGVFYAPDEAGGSTIDHSISLIGIGADGALRVVWPPNVGARALASDVRALLG